MIVTARAMLSCREESCRIESRNLWLTTLFLPMLDGDTDTGYVREEP